LNGIKVGVRIGKGKVIWLVRAFWTNSQGITLADLGPWDVTGRNGYSTTSATLDRLTVVAKANAS